MGIPTDSRIFPVEPLCIIGRQNKKMGLRNDICYTLRRIRWDMRYRWCKGESLRETKDPTQSDPKEGDGSPPQSERDERRKSDTAQVRKDPAERTRMELHLLFFNVPSSS